jgi:hypothetical protein
MDNLPELKDIHLPEGVSFFPPAYGWWVMLFGVVFLVFLGKLFLVLRQKSKKRFALRAINNIRTANIIDNAVQLSEILRRICVLKYKNAAALSGSEWLDFLNSKITRKLSGRPAELLANAPYLPTDRHSYGLDDLTALRAFCRHWIGANL